MFVFVFFKQRNVFHTYSRRPFIIFSVLFLATLLYDISSGNGTICTVVSIQCGMFACFIVN